jgi:hypothetical protein
MYILARSASCAGGSDEGCPRHNVVENDKRLRGLFGYVCKQKPIQVGCRDSWPVEDNGRSARQGRARLKRVPPWTRNCRVACMEVRESISRDLDTIKRGRAAVESEFIPDCGAEIALVVCDRRVGLSVGAGERERDVETNRGRSPIGEAAAKPTSPRRMLRPRNAARLQSASHLACSTLQKHIDQQHCIHVDIHRSQDDNRVLKWPSPEPRSSDKPTKPTQSQQAHPLATQRHTEWLPNASSSGRSNVTGRYSPRFPMVVPTSMAPRQLQS